MNSNTNSRCASRAASGMTIILIAVVASHLPCSTARADAPDDPDQYVWSCTTVDEKTNELVADVQLSWTLRRPYKAPQGREWLWTGKFVSDEQGRYEVRIPKSIVQQADGFVSIAYRHPHYLPQLDNSMWPFKLPDATEEGLDHRHIKLEPGVRVAGQVVLPDGTGAAAVPLMFGRNREGFGDSNKGYYNGFWVRTDQDGNYEFYTRDDWPQRIHWFPDAYENNSRALTNQGGDQEVIRLRRGLTLAGRIVDDQQKPLAGIVVRATTGTRVPNLYAKSDADGIFRFRPLPAGDYRLTPVRSYCDNMTGLSASAEMPYPIPGIRFQLDAETASNEPVALIQAAPLVTIPVQVVDGDGQGVRDANLAIGSMGDYVNAVRARPVDGQPGRYEFRYPQGQMIRDLQHRCSMGEAAFYQLSPDHPPVAAGAIVLPQAVNNFPTVRVVVRRAASLTVWARLPDGSPPTDRVNIGARYGPETENRQRAAAEKNRQHRANFTAPSMMQTQLANQPWNPTFQQLAPGEPIVVSVQSEKYTAKPVTVTLEDGETKSIGIVLREKPATDK